MKNEYEKPSVIEVTDMAEGVYAASGAGNTENHVEVNVVRGTGMLADFIGPNYWQSSISWKFDGGYNCSGFRVTAIFDKPVSFYNYYPTMQSLVSGDNSNTLVIDFMLNESTSFNMMNITVSCDTKPTLTGVSAQCYH